MQDLLMFLVSILGLTGSKVSAQEVEPVIITPQEAKELYRNTHFDFDFEQNQEVIIPKDLYQSLIDQGRIKQTEIEQATNCVGTLTD